MASGFRNSAGVDFDSLFDPYVQGTKPANTGFRTSDGADLANRFAPIIYGTKGPDVGFRTSGGQDVSNLWAAKGTATYALGFNGQSYTRSRGRGTASLTLNMNNDGTWNIVNDIATVLASGSWLNFGGAVSDYTVQFVMTGFANGPSPDGGTDTFTNGAPTASALTTTRSAYCSSSATTINTDASNSGGVQVNLYKSGTLVSVSSCGFDTSAVGT